MRRFGTFLSCLWLAVAVSLPVQADTWIIVPGESYLGFEGTQMGQPFEGKFHLWDADIFFSRERLAESSVDVVIEMGSAQTGSSQRDQALPDAAWFDVESYPEARFAATRFRHDDGDRYEADGTLSIKGKTREVVLPFTLESDGKLARVRGELTIDRTDYGVGTGSWSGGDIVGRQVSIIVDIMAQRAEVAIEGE